MKDFLGDLIWTRSESFPRSLFRGEKDLDQLRLEAAELKERYLENRGAFEALAAEDGGSRGKAAMALFDTIDITFGRLLELVNDPNTMASPIAGDIREARDDLRQRVREFIRNAPGAVFSMDFSDLAGEALKIVESLEALIVQQLPLVFREQVPDYFAGLDSEAPYPSYRYSATNRGRVPRFTQPAPDKPKVWAKQIGGLIWPSAVVDRDGDLYTGHAVGEYVALKPDGKEKWRISDKQMMYIDSTGALATDGYLYMASTDCTEKGIQNQGRLWKIDPKNGKVIWTFWGRHFEDPENNPNAHLSSFFEGNLTVSDENGKLFIYLGADDNYLYKIDTDGNLVWEYHCDNYPSAVIWTKPLLSPDGSTVFCGELSGQFHAVDTATGKRKWMTRVGGSIVSSPALGMYGEIFFGCFDGRIYALAPEDGTIFWSYQTLGLIYGSPAVTEEGNVVSGSSDGGVYCLDRFGRKLWAYYTDAPIKSSPGIDPDGLVYIGNMNGKLYCIDRTGRRVWSFHTHSDIAENDINSSPSFGADGTIYFGSTTGEVFAIPRNYYFKNRDDERIELDPAHDGRTPDIEPGGATAVFMDLHGTAMFDPPQDLPVSTNLNLAFYAVNDNLDVIPAEIDPASLEIDITPKLPHRAKVESMGRFIYIIPDGFLRYNTKYTIKATGRYTAEDTVKDFDITVAVKTAAKEDDDKMPLSISDKKVSGIASDGFTMSSPKEIDALGQAMMDSQKFAMAPIYINEDRNHIALAVCAMVETGGGYEYTPKSVNKMIVTGEYKDSCFKVAGSMRLIAQGANIPMDEFLIAGRFTSEPGILDANGFGKTTVANVPDFEDLIRVMKLCDSEDDCVGFVTFNTFPLDSYANKRPAGVKVDASVEDGKVVAKFDAKDYVAGDHWIHIDFVDKKTAQLLKAGDPVIKTGAKGILEEVSAAVPAAAKENGAVAIVALDLFPIATLEV